MRRSCYLFLEHYPGAPLMDIGIVRETYVGETRVPLIPFAVGELVRQGHRVVIQSDAGAASGFDDQAYREMGAGIVYSSDEAFARSKIVLKVYPPSWDEYGMLEDGQILFSFLQLSNATRKIVELLLARRVTAIGFEAIEEPGGNRPVLTAMSEIAGRMIVPIAAHHLQARHGGRGILLGGVPGVAPTTVVVLGAGVAGTNAALSASAMGAHVIVLDRDVARLRALTERSHAPIVTSTATPYNLQRFVPIADVLVGAVFIEMEATPHLLDRALVRRMRPGSVFVDVAIDQGGCSTTSRPTTILDPVYVEEGVTHFCVPNIPALVPRTATVALSNILLPYLEQITKIGPDAVLTEQGTLARGVYTHDGFCSQRKIADPLSLPLREVAP
jgi:alanine dehydrogenase